MKPRLCPSVLSRTQLVRRSLLLQASWNFERMQGLGVAFVLAPFLRRLYSGEALARALERHVEYFNTHPFLAPGLLGASARIEEDAQASGGDGREAAEFRQIMMAPCAAMGDAFFWGGLRPLAAVVGTFLALKGWWFAPLALLLVFNLPQLYARVVGVTKGYATGMGIVDLLQRSKLPDLAIRLKQATVILLGIGCAELTLDTFTAQGLGVYWGAAILPVLLLLGWPTRKSVSPLLLAMAAVVSILAIYTIF